MRGPTEYEEYLWRLQEYYHKNSLPEPVWIGKEWQYYHELFDAERNLGKVCRQTNIPKSTMKWLSGLKDSLLLDELSP